MRHRSTVCESVLILALASCSGSAGSSGSLKGSGGGTGGGAKPASHEAVPSTPPGCSGNPNAVPMGLRVRLDKGVTVKNGSVAAAAVITAMQTYGMILADNGSPFYFQGEPSSQWNDDADIEPLKQIPASAFKVVQVPPLEP